MKLSSITIQVPTKHTEWCHLNFKREEGLGSIGSLCGSRQIVSKNRPRHFVGERNKTGVAKDFEPLNEDEGIEKLFESEPENLYEEVKVYEEMIPGVSYLVSIVMDYKQLQYSDHPRYNDEQRTNIYMESFKTIDEAISFIKDNEIACCYHGTPYSRLIYDKFGGNIKIKTNAAWDNYEADIRDVCELFSVHQEQQIGVESIDQGYEVTTANPTETCIYRFEDGSKLSVKTGFTSEQESVRIIE